MTATLRRIPGPTNFAEVGVEVWSGDRRRGDDAVGGIVLAISEAWDDEREEIVRSFVVADHQGARPPAWATIREPEVAYMAVPPTSHVVRLWRRLAEQVAFDDGYHRRTGPATPFEAKLILAQYELAGALFAPGGDLYGELAPLATGAANAPRPTYPVNAAAFVD